MPNQVKIFSGSSNNELAQSIAKSFGVELGKTSINRFSDGEFQPAFEESVRGCDVFIVQSTNPPTDNIFELLLMIDAAKRASARRIIAVIPYFGFARQDRKDAPRVPIGSKLMANMLTAAGVSRVVILFDAGAIEDSNQVYLFDNVRMEGFITSIVDLDESEINIYPNPTNEILNKDLSKTLIEDEIKISIISMDGKLIEEFNVSVNSKTISIDVSSISQGIYMLELSNSKYIWNSKVIIE